MSKRWSENGLQPSYDDPEEEADENNEFLKRLKTSEAEFYGLITAHLLLIRAY